eukprot:5369597-Amphidinium_carterae.1
MVKVWHATIQERYALAGRARHPVQNDAFQVLQWRVCLVPQQHLLGREVDSAVANPLGMLPPKALRKHHLKGNEVWIDSESRRLVFVIVAHVLIQHQIN